MRGLSALHGRDDRADQLCAGRLAAGRNVGVSRVRIRAARAEGDLAAEGCVRGRLDRVIAAWFVKREATRMLKGFMNLLTAKGLTGYRTKLIGGGMIATGVGTLLAHLGEASQGTPLNMEKLKASGATILMGYGLLTAAAHQEPPTR